VTQTAASETQQSEASVQEAAETPRPAAPTPEPIVTTYGKDNIVGIRHLRRSMAISHSEAESLLGPQTPEPEEKTETEAAETSRQNLRQPQIRRRLEMAMARSSKTPEKRVSSEEESSDEEISESPTVTNRVRIPFCPTQLQPLTLGLSLSQTIRR